MSTEQSKENKIQYEEVHRVESAENPDVGARVARREFPDGGQELVFALERAWQWKGREGFTCYFTAEHRAALHEAVDEVCDYLEDAPPLAGQLLQHTNNGQPKFPVSEPEHPQ